MSQEIENEFWTMARRGVTDIRIDLIDGQSSGMMRNDGHRYPISASPLLEFDRVASYFEFNRSRDHGFCSSKKLLEQPEMPQLHVRAEYVSFSDDGKWTIYIRMLVDSYEETGDRGDPDGEFIKLSREARVVNISESPTVDPVSDPSHNDRRSHTIMGDFDEAHKFPHEAAASFLAKTTISPGILVAGDDYDGIDLRLIGPFKDALRRILQVEPESETFRSRETQLVVLEAFRTFRFSESEDLSSLPNDRITEIFAAHQSTKSEILEAWRRVIQSDS